MAFEVITLNLIPSGDVPVIHAAQYDVDRPLNFALKLGEDDFNPSGYTLELQIRKVDNNIVTAAPSSVNSNVVTFNTTEQMCACSGTNLGEIQITKDDLDIATLHFYLVVQRDVLAGGLTSASEIHDLEEQIAELVPSVIGDEYYTAEEVDEKIAEIPTFDPSDYYDKTQLYTKTETNGLLAQKANTSSLATVATSGSYNDLSNKPNIPDVSDYYTKEETYSQNEVNSLLSLKADTSSLATVATSGSYNDLSNKPTIPDVSDYYTKEETYSQNEVNSLLSLKADTSSLATVATSGDYDDLLNKPTIPAAQVNSDWNASSGVSEILNKPTVAQYGTELPMSSTEPNSMVADRIEALESGSAVSRPTIETTLGNTLTYNNSVKYGKMVSITVSIRVGTVSANTHTHIATITEKPYDTTVSVPSVNGANGTYGGMINIAQSNGNINLYSPTALSNVNIGFTATYYQA